MVVLARGLAFRERGAPVTPHAQHQDVAVTRTAASTSAATVEGLRAQAAAYQVRDYLT